MVFKMLQQPWSRPHWCDNSTGSGFNNSAVSKASEGEPGAGYCTSNKACGNPPKSWMVLGALMAVIWVPRVSQCALTHRMAVGVGSVCPIDFQCCENTLSSMAFMGLPCPTNNAGMGLFCVGCCNKDVMLVDVMSLMAKGIEGNSKIKFFLSIKHLLQRIYEMTWRLSTKKG